MSVSIQKTIQHFPPVYFALPMSTGIISIASHLLGHIHIGNILFVINNIELAILSAIFIGRLLFYFSDFRRDLSTLQTGAGYLTLIVALCIYGTKNILIKSNLTVAVLGWSFTFALWIILMYGFILSVILKPLKPDFKKGINGSWLLLVVSAQALSISGTLVSGYYSFQAKFILYTEVFLYFLGVLFYLILITLIFYRFFFIRFTAKDFHPSYWINMGAAAITTLSGAVLIENMQNISTFSLLLPSVKMLTLLFWISGTWWIPVLIILEVYKRIKSNVRYEAAYWSLVFPLGVYTVCTFKMLEVLNLYLLKYVFESTIYLAWAAWLYIYVQMISSIFRKVKTGDKRYAI